MCRGDAPNLRKPVPGNGRKVMMLIMMADVKSQKIQRAVIAVGLLRRANNVMFLNPACTEWMQPYRKNQREKQIEKCVGSPGRENKKIKSEYD